MGKYKILPSLAESHILLEQKWKAVNGVVSIRQHADTVWYKFTQRVAEAFWEEVRKV